MKYRKKPIEVEAFQMTWERRWDNREWPSWLKEAWRKKLLRRSSSLHPDPNYSQRLLIVTLEGEHTVSWDDWIIQGTTGELYTRKPAIFDATYEAVIDTEYAVAMRAAVGKR
jgi:hypothetical protein